MPGLLKTKLFWIPVLVLIFLGAGLFLLNSANAKKAEETKQASVKIESPYAAIANGKIDVEGGIIQIAARRGGVVREVYVQEGDLVTAGQILARQEDDENRLQLQTSNADLASAESQLAQIRVDISAAERELNRMQQLAATNFVAAQRLDQARDAVELAKARLATQQAAVQTARARREQSAYNVELTVIRSPANGRIVRRYANPGSGASTLNVSTMFDLEPEAPRIVRAEIVEANIPDVTPDQAVEVTPESDPSTVYVGKVLRRAAVFGARKLASDDPSQRTDERVVEVVVEVNDAPLLIGQRVLVKFMKPGETAGAKRDNNTVGVPASRAMKSPDKRS